MSETRAPYKGLARAVRAVYSRDPERPVDNRTLYQGTAEQLQLDLDDAMACEPIGRAETPRSHFARQVRWVQQTMRTRGHLERHPDTRGVWRLTEVGKHRVRQFQGSGFLVAFSTSLGVALLGDCHAAFGALDEPIHLCLTSPPYPLRKARAYGNPDQHAYVDFICTALEPIVRNLVRGGSIVLNISNDIFEPGLPSRSLYRERLALALHDRLGLHKMDEIIWHNPCKAPAPVQWASVERCQLNAGYEPILWFANDPRQVLADNRRVLQAHTDRQKRLISRGGEGASFDGADGAYRRRKGAFGAQTAGRIPRNVVSVPHTCAGQKAYKRAAKQHGLRPHGAPFPEALAEFQIRFLTKEDHLVVDPFGGSQTTAVAAQRLNRRWVTSEIIADYALGGSLRFPASDSDLWVNPDLDDLFA